MSNYLELSTGPDVAKVLGYTAECLQAPAKNPIIGMHINPARVAIKVATDQASKELCDALASICNQDGFQPFSRSETSGGFLDEPRFEFKVGTGSNFVRFVASPDLTQVAQPVSTFAEELADLGTLQELLNNPTVEALAEISCRFLGRRGLRAEVTLKTGKSPKGKIFQALAPHEPTDLPRGSTVRSIGGYQQTIVPRKLVHGTVQIVGMVDAGVAWNIKQPLM